MLVYSKHTQFLQRRGFFLKLLIPMPILPAPCILTVNSTHQATRLMGREIKMEKAILFILLSFHSFFLKSS